MALWNILPDSEREQWTLEPLAGVGPMCFGMSPDEVFAALGGIKPETHWNNPPSKTSASSYRCGVTLYYKSGQRLHGVSINPRQGPQVTAGGEPTVGRVPSELEHWMIQRAESRPPRTELAYLPGAEPASLSLGLVACLQRAGDRLLTRPVFLPADAMDDDIYHQLPAEAWQIKNW
jgi:hypothetical protein